MAISATWDNAVDNGASVLGGDMTSTALTFEVDTGEGADFGDDYPMLLAIGSEIVRVASRDGDEFTISTLSQRGLYGTTRTGHNEGDAVQGNVFAHMMWHLQARLRQMERAFGVSRGNHEGVVRAAGTSNLGVSQMTPAAMKVQAGTGMCLIGDGLDLMPVVLREAWTSGTFSAPTGNPRKDLVQITADGDVEIQTGTEAGSPTAPTVDADALALAVIALTVGMTEIEDGDITDERVYQ